MAAEAVLELAHAGWHLGLNLASGLYLFQVVLCLGFIAWCARLIWRQHRGG